MNARARNGIAALVLVSAWLVCPARAEHTYTIRQTETKARDDGSLKRQSKEKKVTLAELLNELADPDPARRTAAVRAVRTPEHWPAADSKVLVKALGQRLKDKDEAIRYLAAGALSEVGPEAAAVLPELMEAAKDSATIRRRALRGIARIGPPAKAAVPVLLQIIDDKDRRMASIAALALGNIGKDAVPELVKALKSPRPQVRREAARALAIMGPEAKEALPALKQLLTDKDSRVVEEAKTAVGEIEQTPGRPTVAFPGKLARPVEKPK